MNNTNIVVRLNARPTGMPGREHFKICEEPLPDLQPEEIRVAISYISISPSLRMQMNARESYLPAVPIGGLLRARAVGEVVESRSSRFAKGDFVEGAFGPQSYYSGPVAGVMKIDPALAPIERYLGALGMSGLTAYFGLVHTCHPQAGQTLLVSAAAGSVGSIVGQIGKKLGCHVIGIAGGADKCAYVTNDLNYDACIDYRGEDVGQRLAELAPDGVDIFFDNVGGEILEATLANLAAGGMVSICGAISSYNDIDAICGPRNWLKLLERRATLKGFSVYDFQSDYSEALAILAGWIAGGAIKPAEHIEEGLERFGDVLPMLFHGSHRGKLILKI